MPQHKITSRKWNRLSLCQQMANIGAEVGRAMKWQNKNREFADLANIRALELLDLTISDPKNQTGLKELTRVRELWLDFFVGENIYQQTSAMWEKYFYVFNYQVRV